MVETYEDRLKRCKTFANAEDIDWLIEQAEKTPKLEAEKMWLYGKLNMISDVIQAGRSEMKQFYKG